MRRVDRILRQALSSSSSSGLCDAAYFALPEGSSVVLGTVHNVAHIVLNRPKALNALNLDMIRVIEPTLRVSPCFSLFCFEFILFILIGIFFKI